MNYLKIYKILFFFIFQVTLFAGNIMISTEKVRGETSYSVEYPSLNLRSDLIFPYTYNTIGISLEEKVYGFDILFASNFLADYETTIGKDYDWQIDNLTVFSSSENKIKDFVDLRLGISKSINNNISFINKFQYLELNNYWYNTNEKDYVTNDFKSISGLTLKYEQNIYKYDIGFHFKKSIFNSIEIGLTPYFILSNIKTKDSHLLRGFYTTQNAYAYGYGNKVNINHNLSKNFQYSIYYIYEKLKDSDVTMNYYNQTSNTSYMSLPSNYEFKSETIGFSIKYLF